MVGETQPFTDRVDVPLTAPVGTAAYLAGHSSAARACEPLCWSGTPRGSRPACGGVGVDRGVPDADARMALAAAPRYRHVRGSLLRLGAAAAGVRAALGHVITCSWLARQCRGTLAGNGSPLSNITQARYRSARAYLRASTIALVGFPLSRPSAT